MMHQKHPLIAALLLAGFAFTPGCNEPEQGRYDYQGPVEGSSSHDPSPPGEKDEVVAEVEPEAPEEVGEEVEDEDEDAPTVDDGDLDLRDNWAVWPGKHASWVSFEDGATRIDRKDVDDKAQTMVCNKPGAPVDGTSARIVGRWKHEITDGVGRISARYYNGDQPVQEGNKRLYDDLSIGKDTADAWIEVDRWVTIPAGTDNVRYCLALKGSDAVAWSDDLRIEEWK